MLVYGIFVNIAGFATTKIRNSVRVKYTNLFMEGALIKL